MSQRQRKFGIALSYGNIIIFSLVGIFFIPFLIRYLGDAEYGIYQMMSSFAGYLVIMNFGTGTVMTRYVALYLGKGDKRGEKNFIAMCLIITGCLACGILIVAAALYTQLGSIYAHSLNAEQLILAKKLYLILVANIVVVLLSQAFEGIVNAYERFVVMNAWRIGKILLKVLLVVILIMSGFDAVSIVSVDLGLSILFLFSMIWYSMGPLKVRFRLYSFEKAILGDTAIFSLAILFQSLINQLNSSAGKTVLGIMLDPESVTLYAIAMSIFSIFSSLSTVVIAIYLPLLTKMVAEGADGMQLTRAVIAPCRVQTIISGWIMFGFLLCGRDFIMVWMGDEKYLPAWLIGVIVMVPMFITYINGVVVSILDALRKRLFRSVVLAIVAAVNVGLSIILVKHVGYWGAPIGTAIAILLGQVLIMNIYYHRVIKLNIFYMFGQILHGILPVLLISSIIVLPLCWVLPLGYWGLLVKAGVFTAIFGATLWFKGLNAQEKAAANSVFGRQPLVQRILRFTGQET